MWSFFDLSLGSSALYNKLADTKIEQAGFYEENATKIEIDEANAKAAKVDSLIASAKIKLDGEFIFSDDPADFKILETRNDIYAVAVKQGDGSYDVQYGLTSAEKEYVPSTLPSPSQTLNGAYVLWVDYKVKKAQKEAFVKKNAAYNEMAEAYNIKNAEAIEDGKLKAKELMLPSIVSSFVGQIGTSLKTVFAGFFLALLIAVPLGIVIGLSPTLRKAVNWFIQIFKPVSPVVWLLLVTMIVTTILKKLGRRQFFL